MPDAQSDPPAIALTPEFVAHLAQAGVEVAAGAGGVHCLERFCYAEIETKSQQRADRVTKTKKQRTLLETIALVGNPNVGKSVIFGLLTGKYVTVSNFPGTTVEVTHGNMSLDGKRVVLIDTPGVNTLVPMSEDEKVTRDIILTKGPTTVVQVGDAKNLRRSLFITLQLAEMDLPLVLDLNMYDEAMDRGISLDVGRLRELLGIDVVTTVAPQRKGIKDLREALLRPRRAHVSATYPPLIEEYASKSLHTAADRDLEALPRPYDTLG